MTNPNSSPEPARLRHASEMLRGYDTPDEGTKRFLCSIILTNDVPTTDKEEFLRLSLVRGVEEWDMVFECAAPLRDRALEAGDVSPDGDSSLLPFLGGLLSAPPRSTEGGGEKKKQGKANDGRQLSGGVSRFWEGGKERVKTDAAAGVVGNSVRAGDDIPSPAGCRRPPRPTPRSTSVQGPSAGTHHSPDTKPICPQPDPTPAANKPSPTSKRTSHTSPFFFNIPSPSPSPAHAKPKPTIKRPIPRPPRGTISSLPIPPLSAPTFGLIQESLASRPFDLLIAVTFLIRTHGTAAIPVFHKLMARFPTPEALVSADPREIIDLIRPLGLAVVRCAAIQRYARGWLARPPTKDVRFVVRNYPLGGDGSHVHAGQEFAGEDDDDAGNSEVDAARYARDRAVGYAWEIGHLTAGPYALDSWRIFCRDRLLGRADDWMGGGAPPGFQPEWMRLLPKDKELRACLRWMWMREGWAWDPVTGDREPLGDNMRRAVNEGQVGYDDTGGLVILDPPASTK